MKTKTVYYDTKEYLKFKEKFPKSKITSKEYKLIRNRYIQFLILLAVFNEKTTYGRLFIFYKTIIKGRCVLKAIAHPFSKFAVPLMFFNLFKRSKGFFHEASMLVDIIYNKKKKLC